MKPALAIPGLVMCLVMFSSARADGDAAAWRAKGPDGFAELYASMADTIEQYRAAKAAGDQATVNELEPDIRLLDQVARQRDAYASGLYWFTDMDAAVAEAQRTGRPILSLRLLGNLDEEYSCANSRYFRTVLYADQQLGKMLRERFVLHWQSVRPVPVITIDMGDGRQIKRTLTGNSTHYLLDTHGRVVDVLPGLYGARTFEQLLTAAEQLARDAGDMDDQQRQSALADWHTQRAQLLDDAWGSAFAQPVAVVNADGPFPDALEAAPVAVTKSLGEVDMLRRIMPFAVSPTDADQQQWNTVAARYAEASRLDDTSVLLMREKTVPAEQAMRLAFGKARVEDPLLRVVRSFEQSVAMDTARNEHLLHRQVHTWFAQRQVPDDLDALNARVYAELFLTPDADPWLGLVPADAYSALDGGGLAVR